MFSPVLPGFSRPVRYPAELEWAQRNALSKPSDAPSARVFDGVCRPCASSVRILSVSVRVVATSVGRWQRGFVASARSPRGRGFRACCHLFPVTAHRTEELPDFWPFNALLPFMDAMSFCLTFLVTCFIARNTDVSSSNKNRRLSPLLSFCCCKPAAVRSEDHFTQLCLCL